MKRAPIRRAPWQRPRPVVTVHGSTIDPALRALVRDRAGNACECCGINLRARFEAHHRKLRSQGGQDSAANLAALCFLCHRRVHGHRVWAEEHGFIVVSTDDPAKAPMAVLCESWRFLTATGTYLPAGDAA